MVEVRCDRCGRLFVRDDDPVNLLAYYPTTRQGVIEIESDSLWPVEAEHEFHLCNDCFDRFDRMVEGAS